MTRPLWVVLALVGTLGGCAVQRAPFKQTCTHVNEWAPQDSNRRYEVIEYPCRWRMETYDANGKQILETP